MSRTHGGGSSFTSRHSALTAAAINPSRFPGCPRPAAIIACRRPPPARRNPPTNAVPTRCNSTSPSCDAASRSRTLIEHLLEQQPYSDREPIDGKIVEDDLEDLRARPQSEMGGEKTDLGTVLDS